MDSVVNYETIQLTLLEDRIEYDNFIFGDEETYENVLKRLLEDSKYIALSLKYPYEDFFEIPLPKKYNNWQLRCCEELYNQIGNQGIKSYSENGLAWTRDSGYISHELRNEIEPMVGTIKKMGEQDNV